MVTVDPTAKFTLVARVALNSVLLQYLELLEENESQKVLQVNPGFCSCPVVGTNHPVHPDTDCALVFASVIKSQVLETSVVIGATIQPTEVALHIRNPPCIDNPKQVVNDKVNLKSVA
jgi:hypothetical protein